MNLLLIFNFYFGAYKRLCCTASFATFFILLKHTLRLRTSAGKTQNILEKDGSLNGLMAIVR